eukprot:TRINITY_DN2776_c0_g2_i2.p1 TRINITY_DN2776_c0_g2~~TRINITY_DN2776_c0_g2_i2.p1  ORF type:complete len:713 (-),score=179.29 TRINITY_DN2776_c0_g2_i2:206-2344(-)
MSYLRRRGDASSSESSRSSQVQSTTESFDPAPGYHHDTPTSSNPIMNFLYKETWFDGNWWHVKDDTLSGIAVALAQVPEAVAFAVVAGVRPIVGLYAAFIVGLITSVFGGRPGMISGATGALAVVMEELVHETNEEHLFAAVILMGVIQLIPGFFKLAKFIKLIPFPVMVGFVNGLAIVIGLAQLSSFQDANDNYVTGETAGWMVMLCLITMFVMWFFPYLTTVVPSSLVAIVIATAIEHGASLGTRTVGDVSPVNGKFPTPDLPDIPYTWDTLGKILPYSLIFAAIGLVESLMTLQLIDDLTETHGAINRECIGQGVANFVCGWFGGMGGCAMIGQSMINVHAGGRRRLSGTLAAILLLIIILAAHSVIELIPMASLAGVMFIVVIHTFEWKTFEMILWRRLPYTDSFIIVLVTVVTVVSDLAIAVAVGVAFAALAFAWDMGHRIHVRVAREKDLLGNEMRVFHVEGRLFFGSVRPFHDFFDSYHQDPVDVMIDFAEGHVHDFSGVEAINELAVRYASHDKRLHVRNLNPESARLFEMGGRLCAGIMDDTLYDDDRYMVGYEPESNTCDECGEEIVKDSLRLGRIVRNTAFRINTIVWYHLDLDEDADSCFHGQSIDPEHVKGLNQLKGRDKKKVMARLTQGFSDWVEAGANKHELHAVTSQARERGLSSEESSISGSTSYSSGGSSSEEEGSSSVSDDGSSSVNSSSGSS